MSGPASPPDPTEFFLCPSNGSKADYRNQFLVVALVYHRRAIPLIWMWVRRSRGYSHSEATVGFVERHLQAFTSDANVLMLGFLELEIIRLRLQQ